MLDERYKGYIFNHAAAVALLRYTLERTTHIFTVFVVWSLIHLFLKDDWTMPTIFSWLVRHFSGGAWPGQYFFLILLQLIPLFWLLRRAYERKWLFWISTFAAILLYFAAAYGFERLPYIIQKVGLRPFFYYLPYVYIGIALARGTCPRVPGWLGLTVFAIPIEFFLLSHLELPYSKYLTPTVLFSSIAIAMIVIQSEIRPPKTAYLRKPIEAMGAATLTIFVANPIILTWLASLTQSARPETPNTIVALAGSLFLAAIACGIALGLSALISKSHLNGILN